MKPFGNSWESQRVKEWMEKNPEYRNELTPMMQDYVRKGAFDEHADLANAGLFDPHKVFTIGQIEALKAAGHKIPGALTKQEMLDLQKLSYPPEPEPKKMANGGWVEPSLDVQRMTTHN
jgi:hypothetical protein